jgi:hypothetical protein
MKVLLVAIILLFFLGGCSMIQQKRRIPGCRMVFKEIKEYWGKDPATGLHHIRSGAMSGK